MMEPTGQTLSELCDDFLSGRPVGPSLRPEFAKAGRVYWAPRFGIAVRGLALELGADKRRKMADRLFECEDAIVELLLTGK